MAQRTTLAKCGCEVGKKSLSACTRCGFNFCPKHSYYYVDGNNIAITKNSKPYCKPCYLIHYKK